MTPTQMKDIFDYYYYKILAPLRTFKFQGGSYRYFCHKHNATWKNERAVEIPIIWKIVKKYRKQQILEVGNLLSHYFPVKHDILDKYEKVNNVINQDAVDFRPSKKYDLIVSISTLEHIGWDETPRNPAKILSAIQNLKNLLTPQGRMVVTLPLGYNNYLDELLRDGKISFAEKYYLKRISKNNKWTEVDWIDDQEVKYGYPFPAANGLIIGTIIKE